MSIQLTAPEFWAHANDWRTWALRPLAALYGVVAKARLAMAPKPFAACVPVVCVGNATMGGAGKTPVCRMLYSAIKAAGIAKNPCVVMRGYRASERGPLLVTPTHTAAQVGDEAIMQSRHLPVIVARDRAHGIKYAQDMGFDFILTDDGLQNPTFKKDFCLLVVDGPYGFGNGYVFPAGPLRLPLADTLEQIDAVCVIGAAKRDLEFLAFLPRFDAQMRADAAPLPDTPVIAFAGLGRPRKFLDTLYTLDQPVQMFVPYPDHHAYSDADITALEMRGLPLLTTEKDWVRLPAPAQRTVQFLPVALHMPRIDALLDLIRAKVAPHG